MSKEGLVYRVRAVPDPLFPQHDLAAHGDLRAALRGGSEHLLRSFASLSSAAATVRLLFVFIPNKDLSAKQSRLSVFIGTYADDAETAETVSLLIKQGPLAEFFDFENSEWPLLSSGDECTRCSVVRREEEISPLYTCEFNEKIPTAYYSITPFKPNDKGDFLVLDRVLDKISERVVVDIRIEPVDVSSEKGCLTAYQARLQQINRYWDDETNLLDDTDSLGAGSERRTYRTAPKLTRRQDPLADDISYSLRVIQESLLRPHLLFSCQVMADSPSVAHLVASVWGEYAFREGSYRIVATSNSRSDFENTQYGEEDGRAILFPSLAERLAKSEPALYSGLHRFAQVATVEELVGVFTLPQGSRDSPSCIPQNTDPGFQRTQELIVLGHEGPKPEGPKKDSASEGKTDNSRQTEAHGIPRGIHERSLCKHTAIFGTPGTGKTTAILNIMVQNYERGIPSTILELTKKETRILKTLTSHSDANVRALANELQVFTPGREDVSPLALNPLKRNPGIPLDEHIEGVFECFKAVMPLHGPMPFIIEQALHRLYEEFTGLDDCPLMSDLALIAEKVSLEKGYASDSKSNLRAAIDVRLRSLCFGSIGKVFQCGETIPSIEQLVGRHTIIELDALSQERACILALFILRAIRDHIKTTPFSGDRPRLVVLIDEAHLLAGRDTNTAPSETVSNPAAHAANAVCRLLTEWRALGVGVVIADQTPSAVAESVIKMTSSKLAFRTTDTDDRKTIGGTMLFGGVDSQEISRLETGHAFFFTEGFHRSRGIWTVNVHETLNLPDILPDEMLRARIGKEPWFKKVLEAREMAKDRQILMQETEAILVQLSGEMDELLTKKSAMISSIAELARKVPQAYAAGTAETDGEFAKVAEEADTLQKRLQSLVAGFEAGDYQKVVENPDDLPERLKTLIKRLRGRFESRILPDFKTLFDVLSQVIKDCERVQQSAEKRHAERQ